MDPFGNRSTLRFDDATMLVVETRDAEGNVSRAAYDYRVLSPHLVTDPNLNRTAVAFDARGMPVRIAVMGKEGAGEGDTLEDPTVRIEYDPLAFVHSGGWEPAFVHTFAREEHGAANRRWQENFAYSDGSGRTAMQKVQAAPGLAPEVSPSGAVVFREVENRWIGSGRVVFDNKGNPVKQYEPFFSATSAFETERALVEWGVTPVLRYDPLGRNIRTDLPNGTFTKLLFDAWRVETWDPNDTVLESRWYALRGAPAPSEHVPTTEPARRAAALAARSANTPSLAHLDSLGRTFLVEEDNVDPGGLYRTRTVLDVTGAVRELVDARGVMTLHGQIFDMLGRTLLSRSADAGVRWSLEDTAGGALRAWDARGCGFRSAYDRLRRPTHLFVRDEAGVERLVSRMVYGESVPDAVARNLRGQVFQTLDDAGLVTNAAFDFKGNPLLAERRLARKVTEVVDWGVVGDAAWPAALDAAAAPLLETQVYASRTTYDALNRVASNVTPDGSDVRPRYNPSNLIAGLDVAVRGVGATTSYARDIEYNARGQRVSVVRGDGIVSTYVHDPETFRLARLQTVRAGGHRLQDLGYEYDPVGNIASIVDGVSFGNAAVSASGFYQYDALYRLIRAEGREHPGQHPGRATSGEDAVDLPLPHSNDLGGLARYREAYEYDRVGNILRMAHRPMAGDGRTGGWTQVYEYAADSNRLVATGSPAAEPHERVGRYAHDPNGNIVGMPHLAAMRWDFANRLVGVRKGGGGVVSFAYDLGGSRVRKAYSHSGILEERVYLGSFEIYRKLREETGEVLLARETLHLDDGSGRFAMLETKTVDSSEAEAVGGAGGAAGGNGAGRGGETRARFQLANQLGSAALEVDEAGRVISYEEYLPYGGSALRASSRSAEVSAKRYRYIGQEHDEETGLYYCGARYYAAWLGRWTGADPAGFVDGVNLFAYGRGNPVTLSDPGGMDSGFSIVPPEPGAGVDDIPPENPAPDAPPSSDWHAPELLPEDQPAPPGPWADESPPPRPTEASTDQRVATAFAAARADGFHKDSVNAVVSAIGRRDPFIGSTALEMAVLRAEAGHAAFQRGEYFRGTMQYALGVLNSFGYGGLLGDTDAGTAFNVALGIAIGGTMKMLIATGGVPTVGRTPIARSPVAEPLLQAPPAEPDYLYRGVHSEHPEIAAARRGSAVPGNPNGTVTPLEHNRGGNAANSAYTSWTRDPGFAKWNAMKDGKPGVVLRVPQGAPGPNDAWSWEFSDDEYGELELLLKGVRHSATVLDPTKMP